MACRLGRVRGGLDAGDHPHQAGLAGARGHDALEAVDVVEVVDHDQPDPVPHSQLELLVGLGVAVQDQSGRVGAGLQRGQDFTAARNVEVQALLDHHPLNRRAGERLRRERHVHPRPATAERGQVVAGPLAQHVLGHHDRGGAEAGRDVIEPTAADHQGAVAVQPGSGREEAEQFLGGRRGSNRHRLSVPPVGRA
ncbi:MAG: hypothetical protein QOF25_5087 [Mycobacterium sp.]|nr:hypothetical protein [Mycobacterium sp.]